MRLSRSFLLQALPSSMMCVGYPQNCLEITAKSLHTAPLLMLKDECDVAIDSRILKPGEVFVALKGTQTDGHLFLGEAVAKGASALIIEKDKKGYLDRIAPDALKDTIIVLVADTLQALIALAKTWRQRFDTPIVGITGSLGKTTTKEMVRTILDVANVPAYVSYKNQNTEIGLSLNILKMRSDVAVGIFEVGINKPGEMDQLADILRPTIGLITCVAHAHTGFLGSLSKVTKEKRKIFTYFRPNNIGIIPGDQALLSAVCYSHPVVKFGLKMRNQVQARKITYIVDQGRRNTIACSEVHVQFSLRLYEKKRFVRLKCGNAAMVNNALGASAISHLLGVSFADIVKGLETFEAFEGRFERRVMLHNKGVLIHDCYNASPESMKAALLAFQHFSTKGAKIAVLGDMLELGEKEHFWHRQIGRTLCRTLSIDHLILVGQRAKIIAQTAPLTMKVDCVKDWQEAKACLEELLGPESLVLVKGSLNVGLSNLVQELS